MADTRRTDRQTERQTRQTQQAKTVRRFRRTFIDTHESMCGTDYVYPMRYYINIRELYAHIVHIKKNGREGGGI